MENYRSMNARKKLEELEGVIVQGSGLWVNPDYPFLGASPDGIIGKDTVVEIKCPYAGREEKIKPGKNFPFLSESCDKIFMLKFSKHYYQVQGQMFITGRSNGKFMVFTLCDIQILDIPLDEVFCRTELLPRSTNFYKNHYKKYLATKL